MSKRAKIIETAIEMLTAAGEDYHWFDLAAVAEFALTDEIDRASYEAEGLECPDPEFDLWQTIQDCHR